MNWHRVLDEIYAKLESHGLKHVKEELHREELKRGDRR